MLHVCVFDLGQNTPGPRKATSKKDPQKKHKEEKDKWEEEADETAIAFITIVVKKGTRTTHEKKTFNGILRKSAREPSRKGQGGSITQKKGEKTGRGVLIGMGVLCNEGGVRGRDQGEPQKSRVQEQGK